MGGTAVAPTGEPSGPGEGRECMKPKGDANGDTRPAGDMATRGESMVGEAGTRCDVASGRDRGNVSGANDANVIELLTGGDDSGRAALLPK